MHRFKSAGLQGVTALTGLILVGAGCFSSSTSPTSVGPIVYKHGIKPVPPPVVDPCAAGLAAGGVGPFTMTLSGAVKQFVPLKPRIVINMAGDALAPAPSLKSLQTCGLQVPAGITLT